MSFVLDTNIISELEGRKYSERLLHWLNSFDRADLYLTTISVAEIHYGLALLPEGKRREALMQDYLRLEEAFSGRIIPFTLAAARRYGALRAAREKRGRRMETKDAMIAAICLVHGATLATRNTKDFEGLDLKLVNPFEDG
ncbi:type II toxin-antitoxin system VapC family toxin [Rhizobium sp. 1399]|jgi:predicted nucleic acid-binding protein|uniref:type II toxin-antitoxin system VapC family toxin n=1 Tax=Rhizobium sp. 1399 TaxID=2817758 RepID=UPI00285E0584|nr:type II toxin-antitoxin system VapC family toxin [Rhizobium sp. 1399]MDR6664591.1 putative nucleic acid-binding protein [Rhizobium sp. 1399]